ncbi:MAG: hypothetical protein K5675_08185 [Lachnospiraceae bacterium]|nr:hypothetical protein [Lachnospiraceae bacterium]
MIKDMKQAFCLMKYTANKKNMMPFLIMYPLIALMDIFLYHSLFIIPVIIAVMPMILVQFIFASEMSNFVISGANRKNTLLRGSGGIVAISALLGYTLDVIMLVIEKRILDSDITRGGDEVFMDPGIVLIFVSFMMLLMLFLSPLIYRRYILTMVIFLPCCALIGGISGFLGATELDAESAFEVFTESSAVLNSFFGIGVEIVFGYVVVIIAILAFLLLNRLLYKFSMDRFAFRQMFMEKKFSFK